MDLHIITNILMWAAPIALAIILHEVAHGLVAYKLGDPTAYNQGRLTMNPISHIDPIGTILVPGLLIVTGASFLFGWARPIPVMVHQLRNPRRDMVWVALAGPGANLLMVLFWALLAKFFVSTMAHDSTTFQFLWGMTTMGVQINLVLMVFNLLPMLPLDGGRVVHGLLPQELGDKFAITEQFGMFIIVGLLATGVLSRIIGPPLDYLVKGVFSFVLGGL
ncbi:MAG TPA: site-2 protease family protein [Oceanospirillales bacterium]|nr:site-2 protease family protein [Oceanospirillales bacterium]